MQYAPGAQDLREFVIGKSSEVMHICKRTPFFAVQRSDQIPGENFSALETIYGALVIQCRVVECGNVPGYKTRKLRRVAVRRLDQTRGASGKMILQYTSQFLRVAPSFNE